MGLLDANYSTVNTGKPQKADRIISGEEMNVRGLLDAATNIPVVGDALSGGMALYDAAKGNYGGAAMNALGVFPFISAGMTRGIGKMSDALYSVRSMGSQGHQILDETGNVVGTVATGKAKDAISTFVQQQAELANIKAQKAELAKARSVQNTARRKEIGLLSDAFEQNRDLIQNAHRNKTLNFSQMPVADFSAKGNPLIHQSPSYGKTPGSSYRLVMVEGEPAYARESNHWGQFSTNDFKNGEQVTSEFNWPLSGVETKPYGNDERYAGYILLRDLIDNQSK